MTKYRVQFREVIFTDIEVEAKNLKETKKLVEQAREEAGREIKQETDELVATVYHSKGYDEINLIK
jgi:ribonuclease HII